MLSPGYDHKEKSVRGILLPIIIGAHGSDPIARYMPRQTEALLYGGRLVLCGYVKALTGAEREFFG